MIINNIIFDPFSSPHAAVALPETQKPNDKDNGQSEYPCIKQEKGGQSNDKAYLQTKLS